MANWEALSHDLLVEIARRIRCFDDYTAFRGVCSSWQSAATKENFLFRRDPWLMLAHSDERDFCDLSTGMVHQVRLAEVEVNGKRCFSSKGCLVTIGQNLDVKIVDPFSGLGVQLPNITTIEDRKLIGRCTLSSEPLLASDYVVMSIFGDTKDLLYARPGDETWTFLSAGFYTDVTFYKGQFYAVRFGGAIMACNIGGGSDNHNQVEKVAELPFTLVRVTQSLFETQTQYYIVGCAERLLLILRYIEESKTYYRTFGFQVFEIDLTTKIFTEIKDLGDQIIFLGYNSTFSLEAHLTSCKPNNIYFAEDDYTLGAYVFDGEESGYYDVMALCYNREWGKDMGIYNLQDESITRFHNDKSLEYVIPPMWVEKRNI